MKRLIAILLSLTLALALCACGSAPAAAPAEAAPAADAAAPADDAAAPATDIETIEWDFLDLDSATHPMVTLLKEWSDTIYEQSGHQLKINIRVGGELPFATSEYLDAVSNGSVQMAGCMITAVSGYMRAGGLPSCAYMITDKDSFNTVMGILKPYLATEFDSFNVSNVMTLFYPTQDIYGSGPVPSSYKDLAGMKIRTSGAEQGKFWKAVGMVPTAIDASEVSSALNTNVINAVTTATMAVDMNKWYESMDWVYVCNPMIIPVYTVVNNDAFAALPADVQEVFTSVTNAFQDTFTDRMMQYSDESLANLEGYGLEVVYATDEEKQELSAIAIPLWDEYAKTAGDEAVEALSQIKTALNAG